MVTTPGIPLSVLDLAFVPAGSTPAQALSRTLDLARHAERWGFRRFWLAEHHNMSGIASAATSVVIGFVAGGTSTIRVGAGTLGLERQDAGSPTPQFGPDGLINLQPTIYSHTSTPCEWEFQF
jgi:hypothetical protein